MTESSIKAVLTGDIVGSTRLNPSRRQDLFNTFIFLSKLLQTNFPEDISYALSNFRGDSWQLIVNRPQKSLEISLFIRTYFRFNFEKEKIDSRIAIGIGKVNFIPKENLSAGDGPAYICSGHLLEGLTSSRMAIGFAVDKINSFEPCVENLILLLDHIITSWGTSQCQSVYWAMQGLKQKEIALNWMPKAISQAAVSKSLDIAGWDKIKKSLLFFEEVLSKNLK
jgi:hypothetical protein